MHRYIVVFIGNREKHIIFLFRIIPCALILTCTRLFPLWQSFFYNCTVFFALYFFFLNSAHCWSIVLLAVMSFAYLLFNSCCQCLCFLFMLVKRQIDIAFHNGNHFCVSRMDNWSRVSVRVCAHTTLNKFSIIKEYEPHIVVMCRSVSRCNAKTIWCMRCKSWFHIYMIVIVVDLNYRQFLKP